MIHGDGHEALNLFYVGTQITNTVFLRTTALIGSTYCGFESFSNCSE